MFQRKFACKHKSYDKYPIKKHVLVCHKHRNDRKSRTSPEIQRQVHNETTK